MNEDSSVVRSVVLIDDDVDFLHVMQRRLQAHSAEYAPAGSVEIHAFSDPVEALVSLPPGGICVVIIDYSMPDGTGLDWLPKLIKASVGPVILLTNRNEANIAAEAFRAGAADYIAKCDVMTDDKRLGRAIREAVNRYRLEARNSVLTRELKLVNLELEAKNKRLRELTETAHQFVDDVAHDFRTPLTVIQQFACVIADGLSGPVNDKQRDHLGTINEATRELTEMVNDFLDSSKLKARALPMDRQSHTVQQLFESVWQMLSVRSEPKQITIERTIPENTPLYFGDLAKASRVLINLAINAIKVTQPGHSIQLWAKPTEIGDVQIGITDEGPGLRPEDMDLIFQRFKQLNEPQLSGIKGFGLGLSIVKQLAWLNLGAVQVQSELGKGSTFAFTLPADNLQRILTCFLANIQSLDEVGNLWMLRMHPEDGRMPPSSVRSLVSTFCYPMDLVFPHASEGTFCVLGISRNPEAWSRRIRDEIARFHSSIGQNANTQLDIEIKGPWVRAISSEDLHDAMLEHLKVGAQHA